MHWVRASTDRKYDVMQGYEFSYLPCLVLGAKGYVGVSFSLCAPVYHRLDKAFHEGDFATAQRLQLAVSDFLTTVLSYSMIPAVKALAKEVLSALTYPHLVGFFHSRLWLCGYCGRVSYMRVRMRVHACRVCVCCPVDWPGLWRREEAAGVAHRRREDQATE